MARLHPWRPLRELDRIREEFGRLMDRFGEDWSAGLEPLQFRPHIESFLENGKLTIRTDLPGVDPKDIEIHLSDNILSVKARREEKFEEKKRHFLRRELRYGSFERSIDLPEGIKSDDLKAVYRDGVLELTAPLLRKLQQKKDVKIRVEREEPKKIEEKGRKNA